MKIKKYRVSFPVIVIVTIEIDAEDEDAAIDAAYEEFNINRFVGNGGFDKLIGVSKSNHSIETSGKPYEDRLLKIEAYEM